MALTLLLAFFFAREVYRDGFCCMSPNTVLYSIHNEISWRPQILLNERKFTSSRIEFKIPRRYGCCSHRVYGLFQISHNGLLSEIDFADASNSIFRPALYQVQTQFCFGQSIAFFSYYELKIVRMELFANKLDFTKSDFTNTGACLPRFTYEYHPK